MVPSENYDPDSQSDLDQWVNFNAYLANLDALHFTSCGGETRYGWRTMAYAFKHPDGLESYYRDPNDEAYGLRKHIGGRTVDLVEWTEHEALCHLPEAACWLNHL